MTASADYGVSIVETFTPPANWIPGQKVNKDVYSVNTGNIDAFVKETLSGKLTYTYETLTSTTPSADNDYVELSSEDIAKTAVDGATTMEGGAFLAWTDTDEPLGAKASARIEDGTDNRWVPSKSGVYIFRRTISNAADGKATCTYSGYYYNKDSGKYYKIVIGDDQYPAGKDTTTGNYVYDVITQQSALGAGIKIDKEGKIVSGTPSFSYVKETTINNQEVTLNYEAASGSVTNDRLVITYKPDVSGTANTNTYDATAAAARAEIDYLNAKGASDEATKAYKQALADYSYALALANATNDLIDAANAQAKLDGASESATSNANAKRGEVNTAAGGVTGYDATSATALKYSTIVDSAVQTYATNNATSAVATNYNKMKALWEQMYGNNDNGGVAGEIATALTALNSTNLSEKTSATEEATQAGDAVTTAETVKAKVAELEALMKQYKEAYAELAGDTATITSLTTSPSSDTVKASIQTFIDGFDVATTGINAKASELVSKANAYKTAADAAVTASAAAAPTSGGSVWDAGINAYNAAVGAAKAQYTTDIGTGENALTNNAKGIVPKYSANDTANGEEPAITTANVSNWKETFDATSGDVTSSTRFVTTPNSTVGTKQIPTLTTYISPSNDVDGDKKTVATLATEMNSSLVDTKTAQVNNEATPITIYVNLATGYSSAWEFDESTDGTTSADFYLKHILGAGMTSEQLVDSVELANTVTAGSYKEMTFDLNVGLKSAQITYADDQVTITSASVDDDTDFKLKPTIGTTTNGVTPLTWN